MISFEEALAATLQQAELDLSTETVALDAALARRLSEDVHADTDWPATDRSAMDGFAVRAGANGLGAGTSLRVVGECLAGHPFAGQVADGQAIRIMTGAVVPASVDCVVPVENTSGFDKSGAVTVNQDVAAGDNIRPQGSEVSKGEALLRRGQCIGPAEVGALAVLGIDPVPVLRRPKVAILATGDEVVEVTATPAPHQVRNSNAHALAAQITCAGGEPLHLGIVGDAAQDLRQAITRGLAEADVLLSIGGVSKGTHDLLHGLYQELDVAAIYHGIAFKPGKPTFFGKHTSNGRQCFVFGLPGNPASCFTVFDLLVAPLLARGFDTQSMPQPVTAQRAGLPFRKNWRTQAIPTGLRHDDDGRLVAELRSSKPSGDPFGLLGATGYALIPADQSAEAADTVRVTRIPG